LKIIITPLFEHHFQVKNIYQNDLFKKKVKKSAEYTLFSKSIILPFEKAVLYILSTKKI